MSKFAFIIHPLKISQITDWQPWTKIFPESLIEKALIYLPPFRVSTITIDNEPEVKGYLIACLLTPEQMITLEEKMVIKKIVNAGRIGKNLGAKIIGLGAYTSVVGDKGISIAKSLETAITTGNSLTVATIIKGCLRVAEYKKLELSHSRLTIVGATGSIGSACSKLLAEHIAGLVLCAPKIDKLSRLKKLIFEINPQVEVEIEQEPRKAVCESDIIILASSSPDALLNLNDCKQNAIVCDVSQPSNVSSEESTKRPDVFYFKGGLIETRSNIKLGIDIGLPPNVIYACMAETILLALESEFQNFSIGAELSPIKINQIWKAAKKHNMNLFLPPPLNNP